MKTLWGPVMGSDIWRVQLGKLSEDYPDAASAFFRAKSLTPRGGIHQRIIFPADKVVDPPKAPALPDPPQKPAEFDPADLLTLSAKALAAAIDSGAHDDHLSEIEAAELAGKARKSVLSAIASRQG